MITPPFCIMFHAEADFGIKTTPSSKKLKKKRLLLHERYVFFICCTSSRYFIHTPSGLELDRNLAFSASFGRCARNFGSNFSSQFQLLTYCPQDSARHHQARQDKHNPPLISKGVKKFKLKLSLVFRKLRAAQRGLPSLHSPGSNILRCQQEGFRPAKSGFRKLQKNNKNHGFKP